MKIDFPKGKTAELYENVYVCLSIKFKLLTA